MSEQSLDVVKQEADEAVEIQRTRATRTFIPRVDIYEGHESVVLLADMPGVDENCVDITLEKNILTIRGFVDEQEPEGLERAYAEYRVGDYERAFALSDEVDRDKIQATVKNGVLRLVLPKADAVKTRKIAVRAEG